MKLIETETIESVHFRNIPDMGQAGIFSQTTRIIGTLDFRFSKKRSPKKYQIVTKSGAKYLIASEEKWNFLLSKYLHEVVVATGHLHPPTSEFQLESIFHLTPPVIARELDGSFENDAPMSSFGQGLVSPFHFSQAASRAL